jgi:hypothetical protein
MPKKMKMSVEEVKNKIQKVAEFSNYLCPELETFKMLVEKLRDTMVEFEANKREGAANNIGPILSHFQKVLYWSFLQYAYLFSGNIFPGMPEYCKITDFIQDNSARPIDKLPHSLFISQRSIGGCIEILNEISTNQKKVRTITNSSVLLFDNNI